MSAYDGMLDEFGVLAYGRKNEATVQFLQQRYERIDEISTLTDYGRDWYGRSREVFYNANGADAMRYARSVLRKVDNVFQTNMIRPLTSVYDIQHSPAIMHRYLMAEENTRRLYQNQRIDGFSETYVDHNPGTIGRDHYDYRRVTNGLVREDTEYDYAVSFHIGDDLLEGDRELDGAEKIMVASAWDIMRASYQVAGGEDTTSNKGGKL